MGDAIQIIACKEKGCDKSVKYERKTVRGFRSSSGKSDVIVVYLTCDDNHSHRYEIAHQSS